VGRRIPSLAASSVAFLCSGRPFVSTLSWRLPAAVFRRLALFRAVVVPVHGSINAAKPFEQIRRASPRFRWEFEETQRTRARRR